MVGMETQAKHRPTEKADESIQYLGRIAERGRQAGRQFTGTRERNDKPQALSQRQAGTQGDRPQGQPASGCKRNEMSTAFGRRKIFIRTYCAEFVWFTSYSYYLGYPSLGIIHPTLL
jgi:hypothetical protein